MADENCTCGHEHCNHDHHEHHSHNHKEEKQTPINVVTHDNSIVGSYRFSIDTGYENARSTVKNLLKEISKDVLSMNGIVGHIKAIISHNEDYMISITDEEPDTKHIKSKCSVEGVAIVFGIEIEQMEIILSSVLKPYI